MIDSLDKIVADLRHPAYPSYVHAFADRLDSLRQVPEEGARTVRLDLSVFDQPGDPRSNLIARGWMPPKPNPAQAGLEAEVEQWKRNTLTFKERGDRLAFDVHALERKLEAAEARMLEAEGLLREAVDYLPHDQSIMVAAFLAARG